MAKNQEAEFKNFLSEKSYEDLLVIRKLVNIEITNMLNNEIAIGADVTIADKTGKETIEAKIYGVTEDYIILKEGDNVLKKQYSVEDLLSINGKEI